VLLFRGIRDVLIDATTIAKMIALAVGDFLLPERGKQFRTVSQVAEIFDNHPVCVVLERVPVILLAGVAFRQGSVVDMRRVLWDRCRFSRFRLGMTAAGQRQLQDGGRCSAQ